MEEGRWMKLRPKEARSQEKSERKLGRQGKAQFNLFLQRWRLVSLCPLLVPHCAAFPLAIHFSNISDIATLGVHVSSLTENVEKSCDIMFGLCLETDKVSELEQVIELQPKELEAKKLRLKKIVHGSSKEIAVCLQLAVDQLHANASSSSPQM
ncbi:hypothetical protein DVH24_013177 [Malus domestica]|uniref:Uncharacterized protein n=1 Tax=Malus domestica TaxID=3750 RepID=A0A498IPP8_MALDO|nr:hypothetical protein DVH24_013177 [Malus domestica]